MASLAFLTSDISPFDILSNNLKSIFLDISIELLDKISFLLLSILLFELCVLIFLFKDENENLFFIFFIFLILLNSISIFFKFYSSIFFKK